jgi:hypothetical protein
VDERRVEPGGGGGGAVDGGDHRYPGGADRKQRPGGTLLQVEQVEQTERAEARQFPGAGEVVADVEGLPRPR